jgi:hypothetical protein
MREIGEWEKRLKRPVLCHQDVAGTRSSRTGNRCSGRGTSLHTERPRGQARRASQELPPPERK